jgi:hypothetical protein
MSLKKWMKKIRLIVKKIMAHPDTANTLPMGTPWAFIRTSYTQGGGRWC